MEAKESSIVVESTQLIKKDPFMAPTWLALVPVLIVAMFVLKKFIYISDDKRDNF
tara:strand:+ start:60 stop:224 length:165 start_codon:yes stop_codon:yes gene_type:complete